MEKKKVSYEPLFSIGFKAGRSLHREMARQNDVVNWKKKIER